MVLFFSFFFFFLIFISTICSAENHWFHGFRRLSLFCYYLTPNRDVFVHVWNLKNENPNWEDLRWLLNIHFIGLWRLHQCWKGSLTAISRLKSNYSIRLSSRVERKNSNVVFDFGVLFFGFCLVRACVQSQWKSERRSISLSLYRWAKVISLKMSHQLLHFK